MNCDEHGLPNGGRVTASQWDELGCTPKLPYIKVIKQILYGVNT